jgi:hypothetical protein
MGQNVLENVCGLCGRRESATRNTHVAILWYPEALISCHKCVTEREDSAVRKKTDIPCAVTSRTHSISDVTDETKFTSSKN